MFSGLKGLHFETVGGPQFPQARESFQTLLDTLLLCASTNKYENLRNYRFVGRNSSIAVIAGPLTVGITLCKILKKNTCKGVTTTKLGEHIAKIRNNF